MRASWTAMATAVVVVVVTTATIAALCVKAQEDLPLPVSVDVYNDMPIHMSVRLKSPFGSSPDTTGPGAPMPPGTRFGWTFRSPRDVEAHRWLKVWVEATKATPEDPSRRYVSVIPITGSGRARTGISESGAQADQVVAREQRFGYILPVGPSPWSHGGTQEQPCEDTEAF